MVNMLIIQCDSGHTDGDLIACARYRVYDMRAKALLRQDAQGSSVAHVLFIIHLPVQAAGSSFVGIQGDPWLSCHIDELRESSESTLTLDGAQGAAISEIFYPDWEPPFSMLVEEIQRAETEVANVSEKHDQDPLEPSVRETQRQASGNSEEMVPKQLETFELSEKETQQQASEDSEEAVPKRLEVFEEKEDVESLELSEKKIQQQTSDSVEKMMVEEIKSFEQIQEEGEEGMQTKEMSNIESGMVVEDIEEERVLSQSTQSDEESQLTVDSDDIKEESRNVDSQEKYGVERDLVKAKAKSSICPQYTRIHSCIQAAVSRLQDYSDDKQRATRRVELLIKLIPSHHFSPLSKLCHNNNIIDTHADC